MKYGSVIVGTTTTLIVPANCARTEVILTNASDSIVVYIGQDSLVKASTGMPFYENQSRGHARGFGAYLGPIYGIVKDNGETPTADVRFWETT